MGKRRKRYYEQLRRKLDKKKLEQKREDEKNKDKEEKNQRLLSNIFSAIAVIMSVITLIYTIGIDNKATALTEKINSKEYEISQNLKYQVLQLESTLNSITNKIKNIHSNGDYNITKEVNVLSDFITTPEYLIIQYFIKFDDRSDFNKNMVLLADYSTKLSVEAIKKLVKKLENVLYEDYFIKKVEEYRITDKDGLLREIQKNKINDAIEGQIKAILLDSIFSGEGDKLSSVDLESYPIATRLDTFELFLYYLALEEQSTDPDVWLFIGSLWNDSGIIVQAIDSGANVNVTSEDLKSNYYDEYLAYYDGYYLDNQIEKHNNKEKDNDIDNEPRSKDNQYDYISFASLIISLLLVFTVFDGRIRRRKFVRIIERDYIKGIEAMLNENQDEKTQVEVIIRELQEKLEKKIAEFEKKDNPKSYREVFNESILEKIKNLFKKKSKQDYQSEIRRSYNKQLILQYLLIDYINKKTNPLEGQGSVKKETANVE